MEKNREKRSAPREQGPRGADLIAGRNAIAEALRAGRAIDSLYVQRGERGGALQALVKKAKEAGAAIKEADPKKLDYLCGGANHQGVVAVAAVKEYATVEDLFHRAQEKDEPPFFVVCDELEDPHNLGAILRTAECARGTRGHHPQAAQRGPHLRRGEGLCRGGGIPARGPGGKPALSAGGAEGPGPLDLRRRHGRLSLVPDRFHRAHGPGDWLGGQGRGTPCKGKGGFRRVPALKGKHQLAERFGGGRHPLL